VGAGTRDDIIKLTSEMDTQNYGYGAFTSA